MLIAALFVVACLVVVSYLSLSSKIAAIADLPPAVAAVKHAAEMLKDDVFRTRLAVDVLAAERERHDGQADAILFYRERLVTLEAALIGLKDPKLQSAIASQVQRAKEPEEEKVPDLPSRWQQAAGLAAVSSTYTPK